jgi:hypothetical protein
MSNSEISESVPTKEKRFYCKDCYCGFKTLQHYNYHLESNKHKKRISTENKDLHICTICQKSFSYLSNLSRHRTKCKENQAKEIEQQTLKVDLETEVQKLREENELLKKEKNATIHNNITKVEKQTNIKTQNNIIINYFGNENLTHITDKVIIHCMNQIYGSIPLLIEKIHFDPAHPENNNIQIPNKKLPHAKIMNSKKEWQVMDKKEAIDSIVENGYNMLDEHFQEKSHKLEEMKQRHFRDFQTKYEDGDKDTMKNIKTKVEMLVINNSRK